MSAAQKEQFDESFLKKLEYLYIMSKKVVAGSMRADRKTRMVGSGIEFADHRHYSPGDDFRNLDWRIYGRTEKLFLRMFEEEEDLYIYFLIDSSRSMQIGNPNKWDYAKRVAAALGYIGLCNLDRVSIIPFSSKLEGRMAPTRGRNQVFKIFEFLNRADPGDQTCMGDAFKKFVSQNKRSGLAVVISDFYDPEGFEAGLNFLRYHRFEPIVVQLFDERELGVNFHGELQLVDCETGQVNDIIVTDAILRQYVKAFEDFSQELEDYCKKRQMLYFRAPLQVPFDELILKIFRAGGFIK
ncbi:MAG: DUF58 domain-containing protein [Bradymonadaceae bacterium]|nr:DUF58 domain-containing protein [Lujinxingiaceae bacterium]